MVLANAVNDPQKETPAPDIPVDKASRNRKKGQSVAKLCPRKVRSTKDRFKAHCLLLWVRPAAISGFQVRALLSVHSSFNFLELTLTSQEFLPLFVNLPLDLDFDFSEFLFLASELLFLETNRLGCQILRVHGGITVIRISSETSAQVEEDLRSSATLNTLAELLGTVVFIKEIVCDLFQVRQMAVQQCTSNSQEIRGCPPPQHPTDIV